MSLGKTELSERRHIHLERAEQGMERGLQSWNNYGSSGYEWVIAHSTCEYEVQSTGLALHVTVGLEVIQCQHCATDSKSAKMLLYLTMSESIDIS
jgi:hypothetical protein